MCKNTPFFNINKNFIHTQVKTYEHGHGGRCGRMPGHCNQTFGRDNPKQLSQYPGKNLKQPGLVKAKDYSSQHYYNNSKDYSNQHY